MKGYRWLQGEYAVGPRARPTVCGACGQTEGPIEAHSQSYAAPFGDHIGRFGLCYRCHMAIHTRFNNREAWEAYKLTDLDGPNLPPDRQELPAVRHGELAEQAQGRAVQTRPVRVHTLLDELI